jgi:hypothetical protein
MTLIGYSLELTKIIYPFRISLTTILVQKHFLFAFS